MKSKQWNSTITTALAFATFMQIWVMTHSFPKLTKLFPCQSNQRLVSSGYYYFVVAETNPSLKPLVLWLNGGPGCPSLGTGAFVEHGPFKTNGKETLIRNEFSWNKEANMLYLESPAGVGFSYSSNSLFFANLNDEVTARDNLVFLHHWFLQFPEYKNRDVYITGESYAGHYVPQLAQFIIQTNMKWNLKGIAVGGWTQVYGDKLSHATIRGASHMAPPTQPERSLTLF